MTHIHIREAVPDDAEAMRDVQRRTWLATYPNEAYGITKEDIEARFHEDPETTEARRERRRQSVDTPPFIVPSDLFPLDLYLFLRPSKCRLECVFLKPKW